MRRVRRTLAAVLATLLAVATIGAAIQFVLERRDLARVPPPGRLVDIGGYRLHLWCRGIGTPTVVMDAGLGDTSLVWNYVLDGVSMFTQACAYDRAGQGYSDESASAQTSLQIARDLHLLLARANNREPLVLVGSSFGGFNVRIFATESSRQTVGMVLVDAPYEDDGGGGGLPWFAGLIPAAGTLGVLRLAGITLGANPETEPEDVREFQRATSYRASRFRSMYSEASHLAESGAQVRERRKTLSMPLIVLSRSRNQTPRSLASQKLQAALSSRGCQRTVDGAGHVIHRDKPEAVVDAIRATIEASRRPRGTPCDVLNMPETFRSPDP
jgi:pimeloyl-ACP methyl ester carboxylesterase